MKKIIKIILPVSTFITTCAIASPIAINSIESGNSGYKWQNYKNALNTEALKYDIDENNETMIGFNKQADINLYYTSAGTITYSNMLHLALLSLSDDNANKKEVHFGVSTGFSHQKKLNIHDFELLLKSKNKNSSILDVRNDVSGIIIESFKKIIQNNPNKKINLWWNQDHLDHMSGSQKTNILELAGYQNVVIHLIEDGASMVSRYAMKDEKLLNKFNNPKAFNDMNYDTQILAPHAFKNVFSWTSNKTFQKFKNKKGFENYKIYSIKKLADEIFNEKITMNQKTLELFNIKYDKNNTKQRLFKLWPQVSGLNWKNALHILTQAKQKYPNKKSLIFLGTYGVEEEKNYIKQVWKKYHTKYNIFYKGHPGHAEYSYWINKEFIPKQNADSIYTLESAIPSEELTQDHIKEGLKFDAVITIGKTSALGGFPPSTYDLRKQFLEMLGYTHNVDQDGNPSPIINGGKGWKDIENWLQENGWL